MFLDWTFFLLIPAFIFTIYAQFKVKSTFKKYLDHPAASGMTGAQVARDLLNRSNLANVPVELIPGTLSDHYDPRTRVLRLSPEVYHGRSLASIGVAAHETGHAIQHSHAYAPLAIRNGIFPVASLGSNLGYFLFFIGLCFFRGNRFLLDLGIILFSFFVFFTILTLPVEFNASNRALALLEGGGYLRQGEEMAGARKVLGAAAMTYVAAAAMAILNLVRMLLIRDRRD